MTIDEAIKHAEEVVDKKEREKQKWERWLETDNDYRAVAEKVSCELCAEEHRQLAEWLKDYKRLLEQEFVLDKIREEINSPNRGTCDYFIVDRIEEIIDKYKASRAGGGEQE